jgi:hypothetical protein
MQLSIEIIQHLRNHNFRNLCLQKILDDQCCLGHPTLSRSRPGHQVASQPDESSSEQSTPCNSGPDGRCDATVIHTAAAMLSRVRGRNRSGEDHPTMGWVGEALES